MPDSIPMTRQGYDKLVEELEKLKKKDRPEIIRAIADARAQGDLSENAEYHAAKERQGHIEDRIRYLEDRIGRSEILSLDSANSETVIFGSTVKVLDLEDDFEEEYTLVGAEESDPAAGKISTVSPIGKALIGCRRGDEVDVAVPRGTLRLRIVDFS